MKKDLSVLVVDVSEDWEEVLKAHERGYFIDWDNKWARSETTIKKVPLDIHYPHGSVRTGFNAIVDTVRIASWKGHTIYGVGHQDGFSDGEHMPCHSLQPYITEENMFEKCYFNAFESKKFADKISKDGCDHLLVLGYDRDSCVLATVKGAVSKGITVVTSEHVMLTMDLDFRRDESLRYYKENTRFLDNLVDVWNYLCEH